MKIENVVMRRGTSLFLVSIAMLLMAATVTAQQEPDVININQ